MDIPAAAFQQAASSSQPPQTVAEQVFLATDAAKLMQEMGLSLPASSYKSFSVMGKTFDPTQPDAYMNSFNIKRG
jgi:nitrate/nitrite transport system substrate-binding protein